MKIDLHRIKVSEVVKDYKDNAEEGVVGYSGRLDIRPKYQREFVYNNEKRAAVIKTLRQDFPLNVMYWMVRDDGGYEVLDGQQRTISIAQYVVGDFSIDGYYFHNLSKEKQAQIMDYELMIYFCEGTDDERIDWFRTINIAGEKLEEQELRNAVYTGEWLTDAKRHFSKRNAPAYLLAGDYMAGEVIRQKYLETVLSWIVNSKDDVKIREYMGKHQKDKNAEPLWKYFQEVFEWVRTVFPNFRKIMNGLEWGLFYNEHKNKFNGKDADKFEAEIVRLLQDEDVTKPSGVYQYLLTSDERYLNIRTFDEKTRLSAYERQKGICPYCEKHIAGFGEKGKIWEITEMDADHIKPWSEGGKTELDNCQMLCKTHNRSKGAK